MAQEIPAQQQQPVTMTPLPRAGELPVVDKGYDEARVRDAFEAFRRHVVQLQAQLRVLQAAGTSVQMEPSGHAVRMDALHLIREAAEFADVIEQDAQRAAAVQIGRTEEDIRKRQQDLARRDAEVERYRAESERQRAEILNNARSESRELLADAQREGNQELREAEARGDQAGSGRGSRGVASRSARSGSRQLPVSRLYGLVVSRQSVPCYYFV